MSQVLCPVLGTNQNNLITQNNVDSLALSSYERVPGTVVQVSCYVPAIYALDGPSRVECSPSGVWNPSTPRCVRRNSTTGGTDNDNTDTTVQPSTLTEDTVVSTTTILLIVTSIVALILLAVVILIIIRLCSSTNKSWQTLSETGDDETYEEKPPVPVVSKVVPSHYSNCESRASLSDGQKLKNTAPSWHSHPIIKAGRAFNSNSWRELSVDKFLQDMERSRRENPYHSWRDFTSISTRMSTSTI